MKLNSWPPPPPITAMLMISSLQISKTQNATLKCQQFLDSLLSVMCERVSAPTQSWTSTASTVLLLLLGLESSWPIRINIKTSEPILYRDHLSPMILMPSIKPKYSGCMFNTAMLKYYYEIWVSHFPLKIWRLASTIQANTPKEQLFFLFLDHIAVLQISLVMLFRGYISISFLPILSLI